MSIDEGRRVGEELLEHPEHELYDEATPAELDMLERVLGVSLPPSYRGLLLVGSGGILATGSLLLGTKDPEELGATLQVVARELWSQGLPKELLPVVDGEHFFCLDLASRDEHGECEVVEVEPETFRPLSRLGSFPSFARSHLL
jgi:hypothetical protein